ncbi:DUF354 domain-containing protein [Roseivirga seohaensis]|uniref:DUF354 domain-containing protein n=1 Tax=Roseivirga seohaensis TaxID=1914963 RepID=UPI003BAB6D2B
MRKEHNNRKRILIDIGHPGHVHYFRNIYFQLVENRYTVVVVARDKDVTHSLLNYYKIPFFNRGQGSDSRFGKFLYMLSADLFLHKISRKNKIDFYLSFSSPYAAQVAWIRGKSHIAINDTEHTDKTHSIFTYPFSEKILTPYCYTSNLGNKQLRFQSIMEAFYLLNGNFTFDEGILKKYGLSSSLPYIILRFVSWNAHHDFGERGIDLQTSHKLIKQLESKGYKVLISSEKEIDSSLESYRLECRAEDIHHILYGAKLFIGESATMASESAMLGTFAVYINSLPLMGYLKLEQENGLLKHFSSPAKVIDFVSQLNIEELNLFDNIKLLARDWEDPNDFLFSIIQNDSL